ncbi:MAG: hypothetical protein H7323_11205, partial [Frankiales bacterium]|nr:hypothetical protein [Frankiales bacterium]
RVVIGWADGCVKRCVTEGQTRNTNLAFADREARDKALTQQEFDELYSQEDIGVISRQSCGLGLFAAFDQAADGPSATCTRLSGATPATAAGPVAPGNGTGNGNGNASGSGGFAPVVSGSSLPTTGGAPLLAVAGMLLLAVAAVSRRRVA